MEMFEAGGVAGLVKIGVAAAVAAMVADMGWLSSEAGVVELRVAVPVTKGWRQKEWLQRERGWRSSKQGWG